MSGAGAAAAMPARHGIEFERVVNAVEDLGWDPNGNREISIPTEDNLLIEVPPGEYVFEGSGDKNGPVDGNLHNWGLRGLGDHWSDVVFRTSNGKSSRFLNTGARSNGVLLENVTFDQGPSTRGGDIGHTIRGRDNLEIHDVEHTGMSGKEPYCRWTMKPRVTHPDGVCNIVNYRKTGPSVFTGHGHSDGGGGSFPGHDGTANFIDCRVENQGGDGGLYTGKHDGTTNFYNCYFANNDMAVMRMAAESEMHNCTIVMDWDNAHPDNIILEGEWDGLAPTGTSGLYSSSAEFGKSGGGFYNCDIVMKSTYRKGQAAISVNNSDGHMDIIGCRIQMDIDGMHAIWGRDPANQRLSRHKTPDKPWAVTIEDCSITGTTDEAAILLDHRHGSTIRNCCVQMQGSGPGILLDTSKNCDIRDTNVNTSGRAIVTKNCSASTSGITNGNTCPVPSRAPPDTQTPDPPEAQLPNTISIEALGDGQTNYSFTVDGTLEGTDSLNTGDAIDGTTASGSVGGGTESGSSFDADGTTHTLAIDGTGDISEYSFTVDGTLEPAPDIGSLGGPDVIEGSSASGAVGGGTDGYTFTGSVTEFSLNGNATVLLDGMAVDPSRITELTATSASGGTDTYRFDGSITDFTADGEATVYLNGEAVPPSTLGDDEPSRLEITGTGDVVNYSFTVGDSLEGATGLGPGDTVDGLTASGAVSTGTDAYHFRGGITEFNYDGPVSLTIDGEPIDPAFIGDLPEGTRTLSIEGIGTTANYSFEVSGEIAGDERDSDGGTAASGDVYNGVSSYTFTGDLVEFSLDGAASVFLDGDRIDPSEITPSDPAAPTQRLSIVGFGESASYSFDVSGSVEDNPNEGTFDSQDSISGSNASGKVVGGTDGYLFSGDVEAFDLQGEAAVYVNGYQVSPELLGSDQDARLPNVLVVDGTGREADYQFAVTGTLEKSPILGTVESDDTIDSSSVTGTVVDDADAYAFSGDVRSFDVDGTASVRFGGGEDSNG